MALAIYLIFINILAFYYMYLDKKKAVNNGWRIKESYLLSLAFFGGSLGSLIGMNLFRHKTKHLKFTLSIPLMLLFQIYIISKLI